MVEGQKGGETGISRLRGSESHSQVQEFTRKRKDPSHTDPTKKEESSGKSVRWGLGLPASSFQKCSETEMD